MIPCGDGGVSEPNRYFQNIDSPYGRSYEEVVHESWLGNTAANICNINRPDWFFLLQVVFAISSSIMRFFAIGDWSNWIQDTEFEKGMYSRVRFATFGYDNIEAFTMSPQQRGDSSVSWPSWWAPYNCWQFFLVPWPPRFARYSSVILFDRVGASALWPLVITVYCVLAVMRFLAVVCDGAAG